MIGNEVGPRMSKPTPIVLILVGIGLGLFGLRAYLALNRSNTNGCWRFLYAWLHTAPIFTLLRDVQIQTETQLHGWPTIVHS